MESAAKPACAGATLWSAAVPANRSRTERWRELLEQIAARGGGIEVSIARPEGGHEAPDLMWRVRLFHVGDDGLLVEMPAAAGRSFGMEPGTPLVAVMTVGQNRWVFHTRVVGSGPIAVGRSATLRLSAPERVERCVRREFLRVSTTELRLPGVECAPLLAPSSVIAAEAANREAILTLERSPLRLAGAAPEQLLPEVGPSFHAKLLNLGGGGVGLLVGKNDAAAAAKCKLMWMRLDLSPHIPIPLGITAKQAHSHIDSEQNLYLGLAFEFAFNPSHREFIVEQITRFVGLVQGARKAA
ncbi:MAG: hypothetical protein DYG92_01705 [Leptolyngbya sp. PLA1]|nr:hypothetical protein [Leptolyngbya sp. PLA1]